MHSLRFRTALIALIAMVGASVSSLAHADEGWVRIRVVKGGWFIGASGGGGTLTFHGQRYPLAIGGWTFPGYIALYTVVLNLVVAIVLTPLLNALGAKQSDQTAAADYYA